MPRLPIYVPLLPAEAQAVIGEVHEQTRPALRLLEDEGFRRSGMVDIFEAGPVVRCALKDIRSIAQSTRAIIEELTNEGAGNSMIVANTRQDFRACKADVQILPSGGVRLDRGAAGALRVKTGDSVRFVSPRPNITGVVAHDAPSSI
jgi:arginine N-succinyltransferase